MTFPKNKILEFALAHTRIFIFLQVTALILVTYFIWTLLFVFNPAFYAHIQQRHGVNDHSLNKPLILYFTSSSFETPVISQLTEKENQHLRDVKNIIFSLQLILALLFFFLFFTRAHFSGSTFRTAGIILMFLPLILAIIPFDALFTQFHYIVFPQGNWQFDPETTTLVNIYPEQFFQQFFQTIILFTLITGIIFILFPHPCQTKMWKNES